ncbi:MAG: hypothetical protein C7B46_15005 [Sulfobacillus benefaciens]|uniref:Zinc ribbon domain-containing protein n=1 Tax=Sulfobacillus benefaciens TaxID=453960 RepID=A0A2T2XCU2_9FIRM|nr:MAG: hypothetical protein C7B46_15005 [Sulfobacillus benefaciens]
MQCDECGAPLRGGQAFCGNCGKAVTADAGAPLKILSAPNRSRSTAFATPIMVTTKIQDFWNLGALATILISLFLPAISFPAGFTVRPLQFGFLAWGAVMGISVLAILTAVPSWRPLFWPSVERFTSAALVGSVVTVWVTVLGLPSALSHFGQSVSHANLFGGVFFSSLGSDLSSSIHVGFGLVLALIGTVAWAITTRRAD